MSDQLVYRLTDLVRVINLSKSTIYELIRRKDFPSPVTFTGRSVGWRARLKPGWRIGPLGKKTGSQSKILTSALALCWPPKAQRLSSLIELSL